MRINSPYITGSATITGNLCVQGTIVGTITGVASTASYALNAETLDGLDSTQFVQTGSFNSYTSSASSSVGSLSSSIATTTSNLSSSVSSSIGSLSSSIASTTLNLSSSVSSSIGSLSGSIATTTSGLSSSIGSLSSSVATTTLNLSSSVSSSIGSLSGSVATTTSGLGNRITTIEGRYATTGSNTFVGSQVITGSLYITNDMVVQGCSCLQNITASAVSIGTNVVMLNTATPAVRFAGISVQDSGSNAGVTGSILWDGLCNKWVYSNPTGIGYSGGMLLSGPRTSTLGTESPLTCNYIAKSGGGDHLYDSIISESGSSISIAGTISSTDGAGNIVTIANNYLRSNTAAFYFDACAVAANFNFRTSTTSALDTTAMFICGANGYVGIGSTTPTRKLTISGNGSQAAAAGASIRLDNTTSGRPAIIDFDDSQNLNVIASTDTGNVRFITGTGSGSEKVRITSSGNVGINNISPASRLDVAGNITINGSCVSNTAQLNLTRTDVSWGIHNETNLRFYSFGCTTVAPTCLRLQITSDGISCFGGALCAPVGIFTGCVAIGSGLSTGTLSILSAGGANNGIVYGIGGSQKEQFLMESRTLCSTANSTIEIGCMSFDDGAGMIEANIVGHISGESTSAKYILPAQYGGTGGSWTQALPITGLNCYNPGGFALDYYGSNNIVQLRLRRTTASPNNGVYTIGLRVLGNNFTYISCSCTATGVSAPSIIYGPTVLTTDGVNGNVSIGTTCGLGKLTIASGAGTTGLSLLNTTAATAGTETQFITWEGLTNGSNLHSSALGKIGVVNTNGGTPIGNMVFYTKEYNAGLCERMRITSTGITCFANTICSPSFVSNSGIFLQRAANVCNGLTIGEQGGSITADKANSIRTAGGTSEHLFLTAGINANTSACGYIRLGGDRDNCVGINTAPTYPFDIKALGYGMRHCGDASNEIRTYAGSTYQTIFYKYGAGNDNGVGYVGGNYYLETSQTERFRVTTTGISCFACQICSPRLTLNSGTSGTIDLGQIGTGGVANQIIGGQYSGYAYVGRLSFKVGTWGANTDYGPTEQMSIEVQSADTKRSQITMTPNGGSIVSCGDSYFCGSTYGIMGLGTKVHEGTYHVYTGASCVLSLPINYGSASSIYLFGSLLGNDSMHYAHMMYYYRNDYFGFMGSTITQMSCYNPSTAGQRYTFSIVDPGGLGKSGCAIKINITCANGPDVGAGSYCTRFKIVVYNVY